MKFLDFSSKSLHLEFLIVRGHAGTDRASPWRQGGIGMPQVGSRGCEASTASELRLAVGSSTVMGPSGKACGSRIAEGSWGLWSRALA